MYPRMFKSYRKMPRVVPALVILCILLAAMAIPVFAQEDTTIMPEPAAATVLVSALNVRSGPGTNFARLGTVRTGDVLAIHGQSAKCGWLQVTTPADLDGWVSGNPGYVEFDLACDEIPLVTPAATTVPASAATPVSATPEPARTEPAPVAPTATSEPAPTDVAAEANSGIPDGKGCIAFGNYVGPDLIISGSHWETGEPFDIEVMNSTVGTVCLTPGRWGITISAISNRWRDLGLDLDVKVGEIIDLPLVPR